MPLFSIARRVGDARRPSTAVRDLEWKADPYGIERRPNCFLKPTEGFICAQSVMAASGRFDPLCQAVREQPLMRN
jgi:hypothetical protein